MSLESSSTYRYIIEQGEAIGLTRGRLQEVRIILLRQCRQKFGPPSAEIEARLAAITDLDKLEGLTDKVLMASKWEDLIPENLD